MSHVHGSAEPARRRSPTASFGSARPSGLARNVASNWIAFAFEAGISFFLSPFVIHTLGGTAFGAWVLVISITGYLGFLDLGVRNAVTRFVSRFRAQGNHAAASLTVSSALAIFAVTGAVAITVSLIASGLVLPWFNVEPTLTRQTQIALILSGFSVAAWLINGIFSGVTVAVQRFDALNTVAITVGVGRAIAVVSVLGAGGGLVGLASVELGVVLARCIANTWLAHRVYPELRVRIGFGGAPQIRMIFSFSLFSFFLDMANDLVYLSDAVVIGASLPLAMVTFFAIAANLRNYARGLVAGLANVFIPAASAHEASTGSGTLQQLVLNGVRLASIVVLPITITFMLRGAGFIDLWIGDEYAALSGRVLWILSLTLMFSAASQVSQSVVLGIGQHRLVVPVVLGEGLASLALSVVLVRSMGITGVAWGAALPSLAVSLLFWPRYIRGAIGVRVVDYVTTAWVRPWLALIPFSLITYAIEEFWPAPTLLVFFLQVGLTLPSAVVGFWYTCLRGSERSAYWDNIRTYLPVPSRM